MLRALAHRIVPILTPFAMSAALVTAGCEVSSPVESEIELRAGDEPSAWIVANGDDIADEIVADPAFDLLVKTAAGMVGDLHATQSELSDEELDSIAHTTTQPWFSEVMGPGALLGHLGGNPQDLELIRNLLEQLRAKHGLQEASPTDVGYVFELALATEEAHDKLAIALETELDLSDLGVDPCEQACHNAYVAVAIIIIAVYLAAMAVAVATFPFGIILAQIATAELNRALAQAQAERDICLAECDGTVGNLDFCGEWDVCEEDEYCWKGPLGIGADECRPKKGEGKVCSSHDKCLSGCCKYHVWSHPVSKTCRPASKCN